MLIYFCAETILINSSVVHGLKDCFLCSKQHLLHENERRYSYRTFRGSPKIQPELPAVQTELPVEPITVQGTFSSIIMFLMRQNYIAALLVMMVSETLYSHAKTSLRIMILIT